MLGKSWKKIQEFLFHFQNDFKREKNEKSWEDFFFVKKPKNRKFGTLLLFFSQLLRRCFRFVGRRFRFHFDGGFRLKLDTRRRSRRINRLI